MVERNSGNHGQGRPSDVDKPENASADPIVEKDISFPEVHSVEAFSADRQSPEFLIEASPSLRPKSSSLSRDEKAAFDANQVLAAGLYAFGHKNTSDYVYTRNELADLIENFIVFLNEDGKHILETGLPERRFHDCYWLEELLAKTYPVQCTDNAKPFDRPIKLDGEESVYRWLSKTETAFGVAPTPCVQRLAARIDGLNEGEAKKLAKLRKKVHATKLEIMHAAVECLPKGESDLFWTRSMEAMRRSFTRNEAVFLMKMDRIYAETDDGPLQPGGFTALLEFICHISKECSVETIHRTREAIDTLMDGESGLADVCLVFVERDHQEVKHWEQYRQSLSRTIAEFDRAASVRIRAGNGELPKLHRNVQAYAEWVVSHLQLNGSLPAIQLPSTDLKREDSPQIRDVDTLPDPRQNRNTTTDEGVPDDQNVFRWLDSGWQIRFDGGTPREFEHLVGLIYIRELVKAPKEGFFPSDLKAKASKFRKGRSKGSVAATESSVDLGKRTEVIDREALRDANRRLDEVNRELERAKADNDDAQADALAEERDKILKYIGSSTYKGKPKVFGDQSKKDQDAVRGAISRSIKKISEKIPDLGVHLRNSIKQGDLFSYKPESQVDWVA